MPLSIAMIHSFVQSQFLREGFGMSLNMTTVTLGGRPMDEGQDRLCINGQLQAQLEDQRFGA